MIIGIVADDLTGAADSIAPFAGRGLQADVGFALGGKLTREMPASDARAWSTETRALSHERQADIIRLTRAAARRLQMFSPRLFYKKIDSTLRGHLRLELDAMQIELPGRIAVVCPAFPANGRTVKNGVLYVRGVPQEQMVRAAFGTDEDPTAMVLPLETLRREGGAFLQKPLQAQGVRTLFCDAETDEDLAVIARSIWKQPESLLPVGSAGLSSALASQLPAISTSGSSLPAVMDVFKTRKVLVIVGSLNPVSRRQAAYLAARADLHPIIGRSFETLRDPIREQFAQGRRIVLVMTPDTPVEDGVSLSLGSHFAASARQHQAESALLLTGGDTAIHVLENLHGCHGIRIVGEMEPGIVGGYLCGLDDPDRSIEGRPVILKAGGFGTDETLARCLGLCSPGQ